VKKGFADPKNQKDLEISYTIRIFENKTRIMTTKLTLTVEKSIIERAKLYAKNTGRSLSELIENYLETITHDKGNQDISPKLRKIVGAVKLPKNFDEDKELRSALEKKHL
jgi:formiminotetrahydrofolate cyclodeaminase